MKSINKVFKNQVFKNFGYLSLFNLVNLLLPLVIVPFLINRIGLALYGKIIYAQTVSFYFSILVSFGFNQIATREVVLIKSDTVKLSKLVIGVYTAKLLLITASVVILLIMTIILDSDLETSLLFFLSLWPALQEFIVPEWYFQGIERMKSLTMMNLVSKTLSTIFIFLTVETGSDYLKVPLAYCFGVVTSALFVYYELGYKDGIKFKKVSCSFVIKLFCDSLPIFISRLSQLYIRLNKILIGTFIGDYEVGLYDIGEKIVNLLKIPISMFGQVYFPTSIRNGADLRFLRMFQLFIVLHTLVILFALFFLEMYFIESFLNTNMKLTFARVVFIIPLLLTLIPISINVFFGNLYLFAIGKKREFSISVIGAGVVYFIGVLLIYFFDMWSSLNLSIIVLISEFTCSIITVYFYLKNEKNRYSLRQLFVK